MSKDIGSEIFNSLDPHNHPLYKSVFLPAIEELEARGLAYVKALYSGVGDSGAIDEYEYYDSNGEEISNISDQQIREVFEGLFYSVLSDHHSGWENNEGGYGEIILDLEKNTIELNHSQYVLHTEDFSNNIEFKR